MRVKRWQWVCVGVAGLLLIGKHFLLDTAAAPAQKFAIDAEALHRAAIASGQPLPERIEVEKVAEFVTPERLMIAGEGWGTRSMLLLSHRVLWPNRSLVIDTAMSVAATQKLPGGKADAAAVARVENALTQADAILFTHEHADHVGGVASFANFAAIADKVRMTREQLNGPMLERGEFAKGTLESLKPLDYAALHVVAPGVVLQKAPGHSVGTQLVYVELQKGTRFLFVGDIAWTNDNITRQIGRPRLTALLMKEDRAAVAAQVQALAQLPKDIHVIVAHDPVEFEHDVQAGLFERGFSSARAH